MFLVARVCSPSHTAHLLVDLFSEANEYLLASSYVSVSNFINWPLQL